ncbi:M61 family metallopeptidase [Granulicella paludicola]|uniref:M61 family metallopeptidase n=1 Tax=Granulicella paludicola TaxID=474951 RepID=UPI0021DFDC93|nr:M61 family peptidase [Granulicella paludicola]
MSARSVLAIKLLFSIPLAGLAQTPMHIRIDLTDASRRIIHVTEQIPVHPGPNTFAYPEWIPSQELPGGPIDNLVGIVFRSGFAGGDLVPWRRDLSDPYKFHVVVPQNTSSLVASYDILEVSSRANTIGTNHTSSHVVMIEPSEVVLYPTDKSLHDTPVMTEIHLPAGWKAATALRTGGSTAPSLNGPDTTFQTVSIEQLIDSPILAGDHCRQYPLAPEIHPVHTLDVCSDKDADLELQPAFLARMTALVQQATKLFVGHHYEHYDFLVGASPHLHGDSAEHTQSADYIVSSLDMSDIANAGVVGSLLPHEFTHSWCGKYRRPAGEATADDNTPMQNDLIWVYEGFTQYYGNVLAARAGFRTPDQTVGAFDYEAFQVDKPGRRWRSVQDTADASAILRGNDSAWASWRLSQDYYYAGTLLWLEADVKIREVTRGKKSLDDFAALFFAPPVANLSSRDTAAGVFPYTLADLLQALNTIAPFDWQGFWQERLNALNLRSLTGGLEAAGYSYVYQSTMIPAEADFIKASHMAEMYHSLGLQAMADGTLLDVWIDSPAYAAGLGPGDKLIQVNAKPYSAESLTAAVHASLTNNDFIVLEASRDDETHVYKISYHGGERYAALVRNGKPDLLTTKILLPK